MVNSVRLTRKGWHGGPPKGPPSPIIGAFAVDNQTIQPGQSVTLTWTTTNATTVTLDGVAVPSSGSSTQQPAQTHTYVLSAQNASATVTDSVTVTVAAPPPPPPPPPPPTVFINSFTGSATSITQGQSVTLTWATENATSVTLDGASVAASGSTTVTPGASHTYVLQANGTPAPVSASVSVTVSSSQQPFSRVQIATGPTSWISANKTLHGGSATLGGDAWTQPGGDWTDANGTFDGATSSINVAVTAGQPTSVSIANLRGDLFLRGPRIQWDSNAHAPIFIDQAQAESFWVDASTAGSIQNVPNSTSSPGDPVFVRNPTNGSTLTVTPFTSGTMRIDLVAGPPIVDYPMTGPSNSPSIMELDLTDVAAINAQIPSFDIAQPYAFNPEFAVDPSGLNYLRFSSNPASDGVNDTGLYSRLISWFYVVPLASRNQLTMHGRYCLYIEPDMVQGFNELGMKLPGLSNGFDANLAGQTTDDVSLRMEHSPPAPNNNGLTGLLTYSYAADSGPGFGLITAMGPLLRTGRWYSIEQRAVMNTVGAADGEFTVWLNGVQVYHKTNVEYRTVSSTAFNMIHVNVYHGGLMAPKALMHYRIARIAASTSYIGPPSELVTGGGGGGTLPAWRSGWSTPTFQWASISGTSASVLSGDGMQSTNIEAYCGFGPISDATRAQWIGTATAGHVDGNWNGVFGIDFMADAPAWTLLRVASNPLVTSGESGPSMPAVPYAHDGQPNSRHTYWNTVFSPQRNRIFLPFAASLYIGAQNSPHMDGFSLATNTWDPGNAATWPDCPAYSPDYTQSWFVCDPSNGDLYLGQGGSNGFSYKWANATSTWSKINAFPYAGSCGALFDTKRRRIVRAMHGAFLNVQQLDYYNVDTQTQGVSPVISGMPSTSNSFASIDYDSRNDFYWLIDNSFAYQIDPNSWTLIRKVATPEVAPSPAEIFGRFAYFPNIRGLVYYVSFAGTVWFMATE